MMAQHPALNRGNVAVVTGGASGIGLAAAKQFAALGLKVCIADLDRTRLNAAAADVAGLAAEGGDAVLTVPTDVSKRSEVEQLAKTVRDRFGNVDVLMANAGIQPGSHLFGSPDNWQHIISVNLWGIIHATQVFVPTMTRNGRPGVVINTGSKQGITCPPGDPAYNISKAGVKVFTEALQHEIRNIPGCMISAHLLIPGFVFTPLTAKGRVEQPVGAWTPEQTIQFMLDRLIHGDFYILCPDNDVPRALDERRIAWAAGDIIENRPPLSRWHPDFAEVFRTLCGRAVHLR
jgi:NAD(P)-dependent dehydrogenase (short-subunit alcohol dehydrogenase family)